MASRLGCALNPLDASLLRMTDGTLPLPQEIKKILQGLSGLKVVGADIVEVAPGT